MTRRAVAIVLAALLCMFGAISSRAEISLAGNTQALISTPAALHVFKKGLDAPGDMVLSGKELLVSNVFGGFEGNGSVTELNAATGAVIRTISGPRTLVLSEGGQSIDGRLGQKHLWCSL